MTPELMFSAFMALGSAAFAFLLNERKELKATIKEFTVAAAIDNEKKTTLADRVPLLLAKIDELERRIVT